jgi:2-polyprenyl-3-methyl-5-hydroxy-6-metoxy-1,4-benzoquinol methylase
MSPAASPAEGDPRSLRSHFDRHAAEFDRLYAPEHQGVFARWLNRTFRSDIVGRFQFTMKCIADLNAKGVLDIGCGSGRYLAALAQRGVPHLVGIDLSNEMLVLAHQDATLQQCRELQLIQGEFLKKQFNETFDVVIAMGYFDYQADPVAHLTKMRSLAHHAVIASFPSWHWYRTPIRRLRMRLKRQRVYFYDAESVARVAREAGFSQIRVEKLPGAGMNFVAYLTT